MKTVLVLGTFDGVHNGHKALFNKARTLGEPLVLLFEPNPAGYFESNYKMLTMPQERRDIMRHLGLKYDTVVFDNNIAGMSAEDYIAYLCKKYNPYGIVIGYNHRFGVNASGTPVDIISASSKYGYKTFVVPPERYNNEVISSTRIRKCLADGMVDEVNNMLGYNYTIYGKIVHGKRLGTEMGIPTVNTGYDKAKLLPKNGVYATYVTVNGKKYSAVTNIGARPTVDSSGVVTVESFILGFADEVYGEESKVELLKYIREERKFGNTQELAEQAARDAAIALAYIKTYEYRNGSGIYGK